MTVDWYQYTVTTDHRYKWILINIYIYVLCLQSAINIMACDK